MAEKPGQELLTLVDLFKSLLSTGILTGGDITDAGGGNINVTAGTGYARESDSKLADIFTISWLSDTIAMTTGTTRNIYAYYNAGTPIVTSFVNAEAPNLHEYIYIGEAHYHGTTMTIHVDPRSAVDITKHLINWNERIMKYRVENGFTLSDPVSPSKKIAISAGTVFDGHLDDYDLGAIDTNVSDTFTGYYKDGLGAWTTELAQTDWESTKYDDGSGTLLTMTDGYWSTRWVYMDRSGKVGVMYGEKEYPTFYQAREEEHSDDIPPQLGDHSFSIGYIIFEKGSTDGTFIDHRPVVGNGFLRNREPVSSPKIFGLVSDSITAPADILENTLYSVTVPAGTLNANSVIRVRGSLTFDNSGNSKTYKIYFGDATPRLLNFTYGSPGDNLLNLDGSIINRDSLNSQMYKPAESILAGISDGVVLTSTIDTSVDQILSLSVQKTVDTDLIRLEYLIIEIL